MATARRYCGGSDKASSGVRILRAFCRRMPKARGGPARLRRSVPRHPRQPDTLREPAGKTKPSPSPTNVSCGSTCRPARPRRPRARVSRASACHRWVSRYDRRRVKPGCSSAPADPTTSRDAHTGRGRSTRARGPPRRPLDRPEPGSRPPPASPTRTSLLGSWPATTCPRLADCDPITGDPDPRHPRSGRRYEHPRTRRPGARRCEETRTHPRRRRLARPRPRHPPRDTSAGSAYDYIHAMVDDHSRWPTPRVLPDEKGATCAVSDPRRRRLRRRRRSPRIHRVLTDNARNYRDCRVVRRTRSPSSGRRQKFIRPHCPWTNGKVERFNRTLARRMGLPPSHSTATTHRTLALTGFLDY